MAIFYGEQVRDPADPSRRAPRLLSAYSVRAEPIPLLRLDDFGPNGVRLSTAGNQFRPHGVVRT
jgi:hypothetical protein